MLHCVIIVFHIIAWFSKDIVSLRPVITDAKHGHQSVHGPLSYWVYFINS